MKKLGSDLPVQWILVKGGLFLLILVMSTALTVISDDWRQRVASVLCVIWSSARFYYFMFYVIEKYVDEDFRFSGVGSFLCYWWKKRRLGED